MDFLTKTFSIMEKISDFKIGNRNFVILRIYKMIEEKWTVSEMCGTILRVLTYETGAFRRWEEGRGNKIFEN